MAAEAVLAIMRIKNTQAYPEQTSRSLEKARLEHIK
jgi:hypothetical protein